MAANLLPGAIFFPLPPFPHPSFNPSPSNKVSMRLTISVSGGHFDQLAIQALILRKDEKPLEMGRGNVGRT